MSETKNEDQGSGPPPHPLMPSVDWTKVRERLQYIWAKAFWPILLFVLGLAMGENLTEKRIVDDCRFSSNFRVNHQAFTCQRRI